MSLFDQLAEKYQPPTVSPVVEKEYTETGAEVVARPVAGLLEVEIMPVMRKPDLLEILHPWSRGYQVARRRKFIRNNVERWRKARGWIRERMDVLVASGWTREELLASHRTGPRTGWGLAWQEFWSDGKVLVDLTEEGWVRLAIHGSHGVVYQVARPMAAVGRRSK